MRAFQRPFYLTAIILAALAVIPGGARATDIATNTIAGITFSVPGEYIYSWKVEKGAKYPENMGVAFSVPGHEPLGIQPDANGKIQDNAERRKQVLARGEEIINLMIQPDLGSWSRYQSQYEAACRGGPEFRAIEKDGVAGHECVNSNGIGTRIFPIASPSGKAMLVCLGGVPNRRDCSVFVEGRDDKISLWLMSVNPDPISKIPSLIDAADQFIAQKMTRVPAAQ